MTTQDHRSRDQLAVLSNAEMYEADRLAMTGGAPGVELMATAGTAVADAVRRHHDRCRVLVLCGPGNNGGDGFVAARVLQDKGWPVKLALLGDKDRLRGDAAHHAALWSGAVHPFEVALLDDADVAVDAVFGAGLARPLEGAAKAVVEALASKRIPTIAVDVPSGIAGDSGAALGDLAVQASHTVTFFRKKPGHLLLPGARHCGTVEVVDIGIPDAVLEAIAPATFENGPGLWADCYPWRRPESHKYHFGHAVITAGPVLTGAAVLAARGALRVGAGLVSIACHQETKSIYATAVPSAMAHAVGDGEDYVALIADPRRNAVLIGPGAGVGEGTRAKVRAAVQANKRMVLDADALTSFQESPESLFAKLGEGCVLTPHEGEFKRLFPALTGDKLARARQAAALSGAVVLLKGADSVIAAPDGRAAINVTAPPELATGGTGDVLAGLIVGLLAQGLDAFAAAAAGAWIHGAAATGFGPGLIAEDLPGRVPAVLGALRADR